MNRPKRPFLSLPPETQKALIRCSEHGAATTQTLMQLAFAAARKSAKGAPHLRNENSRINSSTAQKRIKTLENEGYLGRIAVSHEVNSPPLWILLPHEISELSFIEQPTGDVHARILRSRVAAGLAGLGFVVGRDPVTVGAWSGHMDQTAYRCRMCRKPRQPVSTPCSGSPGQSCQLQTTIDSKGREVIARADVAFKVNGGVRSRRLVWVDDGRSLPEQWGELLPFARLPLDPSLKVVVRPADFDSPWSKSAGEWREWGPRLREMRTLVLASGLQTTRGGPFGHRFVVA